MKKRNVKYSKENIARFFRELRNFISHNKRHIAGTTGVAAITSFITFTSAIAPTIGCNPDDVETLANSANNFVNEQTVKPENTTQNVNIPVDIKPTVEPEKTEPVTQDPVEPVEEINPRDMQAVYGLDFEVPIYTEEEVAEAQKYLEENEESIPYLVKDVLPGTDIEAYRNVIDEDKIEEISHNYYIVNQDNIYKAYSQFVGLDYDALNNDHVTGFVDEENNAFAKITYESESSRCIIDYYNKDTKIAISIGIGGGNKQNEEEIGKLSFVKYVRIAPNASLSVINPDYFDMECEYHEELINKIPDMFIATPDTINNYNPYSR